MRFFLEIAYKGTPFHGWQIQENAVTVQGELERALEIIFKQEIQTLGSGRTDTGVHAEQQFVQFEVEKIADSKVFLSKLNGIMPKEIAAKNIFKVEESSNVRFDAEFREYEYRISTQPNPFLFQLAYFQPLIFNLEDLNKAATVLAGFKDFTSFSKVHTQVNNFDCSIHFAGWEEKNGLLIFRIRANRFLRGMVRALVGTQLEIGRGRLSVNDLYSIQSQKNRSAAGPAVPPEGLFLTKVGYPEGYLHLLT